MNCPKCKAATCVIDSRSQKENTPREYVRRVRACPRKGCGYRFTTYEVAADAHAGAKELARLGKIQAVCEEMIADVQAAEPAFRPALHSRASGLPKSHARRIQVKR